MQDETVIPILGEDVIFEKRRRAKRRVRVSTVTRQQEEQLDCELLRENVELERVPIGKIISEVPAVREEGDSVIIPVVEEVLVVERRLLLKEEIRVHRTKKMERHHECIIVRRQEGVVAVIPEPGPVKSG